MKIDDALDLSIENVIRDGLDDIFPRMFEIDLLKNAEIRKHIKDHCLAKLRKKQFDEMEFSPIHYSYFPKKEAFDFRKSALISPWDLIKYQALCISIAEDIEKYRLPKENSNIFSYRFAPSNGYLFDQNYNYKTFQRAISERVIKNNYKLYVKTDIANFYDRLNLHRLENALLSCTKDKQTVKAINNLLLFWSNRDSYGLPVGSNASRILAEAELIEVDNYLISKKIDFVRFVDDYRIFAHSAKDAHYYLNLIIARLSLEGLSVNTAKTAIETPKNLLSEAEINSSLKRMKRDGREKNSTRLIAGYSGLIPTKFRKPSNKEAEIIKEKDINLLRKQLIDSPIFQPAEVRDFVKCIVVKELWSECSLLLDTAENFPQFIPYLTDVFIKYSKEIEPANRENIKSYFSVILQDQSHLPEYIYIAAVNLLTSKSYESKFTVLNFYRDMKKSSGPYIARHTLEKLIPLMTRGEIIEIKNEYSQVGPWERRIILKSVLDLLEEEESRPWIKNIRSTIKFDPFSEAMSKSDKSKVIKPSESNPEETEPQNTEQPSISTTQPNELI